MALIYGEPTEITTDRAGARLTTGAAIPGPGRRLTITEKGATQHVDLDAAAVEQLILALTSPIPAFDRDTGEPWKYS